MQLPYITQEEAGQYFGIIVQGEYPLKYLLGGAIALYVSRTCGTVIIDERCFWSKERETDADSFGCSLKFSLEKNNNSTNNLQNLSEIFYDSLPKGRL